VAGVPANSGEYLISANFFRTRDSFRQDILDQSQVINVMTSVTPAAATPHAVYELLKAHGLRVDPRVRLLRRPVARRHQRHRQRRRESAHQQGRAERRRRHDRGRVHELAPAYAAQITGLLASIGIDKRRTRRVT